jgi:hypothetical protein
MFGEMDIEIVDAPDRDGSGKPGTPKSQMRKLRTSVEAGAGSERE